MEQHCIPPIYDEYCTTLILGSFPSVTSRETLFFYGHPQNRFWKVLAALLDSNVPETHAQKRTLLLLNHIALWDVIESCEITGSSDSSIKNIKPNDIVGLTKKAPIKRVFTNGAVAHNLYRKYCFGSVGLADVQLPSTSPANAACSLARLLDSWSIIVS